MHNESQREMQTSQSTVSAQKGMNPTHTHTLDICVVITLLSSGQARCAGTGGAAGSGGVWHEAGELQAPPAPRGGELAGHGAVQQRSCRPSHTCTQRHHPRSSAMVRGCSARCTQSPRQSPSAVVTEALTVLNDVCAESDVKAIFTILSLSSGWPMVEV